MQDAVIIFPTLLFCKHRSILSSSSMNISSIAITTLLAAAANVRGDGSAALQPDATGIKDKQHVRRVLAAGGGGGGGGGRPSAKVSNGWKDSTLPLDTCAISYAGNQGGLCEFTDPELKTSCDKNAVLRAEITDGGWCPEDVTGKFSDVTGVPTASFLAQYGLGFDPDQEVSGMNSGDIECYNTYETPEGDTVALFGGRLTRCKVCWKGSTNFVDNQTYPGCSYDCSQLDSFAIAVKKNADGTIQHTGSLGWVGECPSNPDNPPLEPCQPWGPVCNVIASNPRTLAAGIPSGFFDAGNQNNAKFTCNVDSADPSSKGQEKGETWNPHLSWNELESSLSDPNSLKDAGPEKYIEECVENPIFEKLINNRTAWFLIDQPSGVCSPHMYCGLNECDPKPDADNDRVIDRLRRIPETANYYTYNDQLVYSGLPLSIKNWLEDPTNPRYNIPPKVLHPQVASDVVKAVTFAKDNGLQLSVKNSGHSYTASSMKANTLLLNMRKYMTELIDITSCEGSADSYERGDPCKLAMARGKPGFVRVSGGRNWAEVYEAVQEENKRLPAPKYLVVGGAAATVSPMGWTWQGGLGGTTMARANGFGADQVLRIEMVLANGWHVEFGPTEWEANDPFVPRTTEVVGKCNTNLIGEEPKWEDCPEEFPFKDLWKAIRGGGGGWGVVLSSYIQLNDYEPLEKLDLLLPVGTGGVIPCPAATNADQDDVVLLLYQKFKFKFALDPESLGVSQAQSDACGTQLYGSFFCFGKGSGRILVDKWLDFIDLDENRALFIEAGFNEEQISSVKNCNTIYYVDEGVPPGVDVGDNEVGKPPLRYEYVDYAEFLLYGQSVTGPNGTLVLQDQPPPNFLDLNYMTLNIVTPKEWIVKNLDEAAKLFPSGYLAFGGSGNELADDQLNAVPDSYRNGGDMMFLWLSEDFFCRYGKGGGILWPLPADDAWFTEYFPSMFNVSDKGDFPSFLGSNHYTPLMKGPLKSDWTKACPLEWTQERRDMECISVQEAVWGTKLLKELEKIKTAVDPTGMFTCNNCICDNKDCSKDAAEVVPWGVTRSLSLKGQVDHEDEFDFKSGGVAAKASMLVTGLVTMMAIVCFEV